MQVTLVVKEKSLSFTVLSFAEANSVGSLRNRPGQFMERENAFVSSSINASFSSRRDSNILS